MPKLNNKKIRVALAEIDKPKSWLAAKIGITRQYLHQLMKAQKIKYVNEIAMVLNLKPEDLIE